MGKESPDTVTRPRVKHQVLAWARQYKLLLLSCRFKIGMRSIHPLEWYHYFSRPIFDPLKPHLGKDYTKINTTNPAKFRVGTTSPHLTMSYVTISRSTTCGVKELQIEVCECGVWTTKPSKSGKWLYEDFVKSKRKYTPQEEHKMVARRKKNIKLYVEGFEMVNGSYPILNWPCGMCGKAKNCKTEVVMLRRGTFDSRG